MRTLVQNVNNTNTPHPRNTAKKKLYKYNTLYISNLALCDLKRFMAQQVLSLQPMVYDFATKGIQFQIIVINKPLNQICKNLTMA